MAASCESRVQQGRQPWAAAHQWGAKLPCALTAHSTRLMNLLTVSTAETYSSKSQNEGGEPLHWSLLVRVRSYPTSPSFVEKRAPASAAVKCGQDLSSDTSRARNRSRQDRVPRGASGKAPPRERGGARPGLPSLTPPTRRVPEGAARAGRPKDHTLAGVRPLPGTHGERGKSTRKQQKH